MNELYNILMSENIEESINSNIDCLLSIIPELKNMIGFEHKHPHHHLDVWNHTLLALSLSSKDFDVRLSLLLHDIGKPFSYTEENGIRHYNNHAVVSSKMSESILSRIGYDKNYVSKICKLIELHDTPIKKEDLVYGHELLYKRYLIQYCDAYAHNPDKLEKRIKYLNNTKMLILKDSE